jgi:hypothetical protein
MCTKSAKSAADSSTRQEGPDTIAGYSLLLPPPPLMSLTVANGSNSIDTELSAPKLAVAKDWLLYGPDLQQEDSSNSSAEVAARAEQQYKERMLRLFALKLQTQWQCKRLVAG